MSLLRFRFAPLLFAALIPALFVALVAAAPFASAQETMSRADYARLPVCELGADGRSLAVEPCRTAPAQRPMPRRPVPQQRDETRPIGIPDTRPDVPPPSLVLPSARLEQRAPYPAGPVPPVPPSVNPQSASQPTLQSLPQPGPGRPQAATCSGGTCRDAGGTIYNGSGTVVSPTGRMCINAGGFVTCQ